MATGAPGTNGVWQYGEDDSEATFSALLNKVASTTNTQIGTDRGRLTTLEARPLSGLVPIVPSSIVVATGSGSANALGQVTFTGATSLSLNNIFTTTYDNYVIKIDLTGSTNAQLQARWRISGADSSTANYLQGGWRVAVGGTTASYSGTAFNYMALSDIASFDAQSYTMQVINPRVAKQTNFQSHALGFLGGTGAGLYVVSGYQSVTTLYDGITLFPNGGTITGTISVYGYRE